MPPTPSFQNQSPINGVGLSPTRLSSGSFKVPLKRAVAALFKVSLVLTGHAMTCRLSMASGELRKRAHLSIGSVLGRRSLLRAAPALKSTGGVWTVVFFFSFENSETMMRTDRTGTGEKGGQNPPCACRRNTLPGTNLLRASAHTGVPKKAFPKRQADVRYEKAGKKRTSRP